MMEEPQQRQNGNKISVAVVTPTTDNTNDDQSQIKSE